MDFSRDGKQLVTAGGDKLIKVWEFAAQKELARLEGHTAQVLGVAFNTNATQVVSGGADKQLKVWDVQTREKIIDLGKHSGAITAVAWPGDGKTIVASTHDGARFHSTRTSKRTRASKAQRPAMSARLGEAGDAVLCIAVRAGRKDGFSREATMASSMCGAAKESCWRNLAPSTNAVAPTACRRLWSNAAVDASEASSCHHKSKS